MYNLYIPVCGLFIIVFVCVAYFTKERVKNFETNIFSAMLLASLMDSLFMTILLFISYVSPGSLFIIKILNKLDFFSMYLWLILFFVYMQYIAHEKTRKYDKYISVFRKFYIVINCIIILLMLLMPINIVITEKRMYSYGPSLKVIYIAGAIYYIIMIISLLLNVKKINTNKCIPMFILTGLLLLVFIFNSYDPSIIVVNSVIAYVNLIMFHTIENPDVKMINQLELARDQADKANKAKTDFLSSMSHEIRTPLNAITGFSDCIVNSKTLDEAKTNAKDIIDASNTLLEIVNGILDISKIEAGKLEIVNSQYDAPKLFNNLAKLINPRVNEKGLDFQVSIAPDLPHYLYGDHANLKKVVTNLLSNAAKYTKTGFVKYEVNCVNQQNTTRLIISVEDSGQGIKKENIDKLFTKFQRLEEDRNTTIEGTGLGLAITKQLVEMMGGKIIVHSVYGVGSKFTVLLDQKIEDGKELIQEKQKNISIEAMDLSKYRILIVDDNQLNLKVASKLLQRYHANVSCLDSGFACLEEIKINKNYDIILMDDMMPKMSGSETFEKLKEIDGFNIPVVALTANAISGMREKYLSIGFDDYLAKPIEKDELARVLNKFVLNKKPVSNTINLHSSEINDSEEIEQLEDEEPINNISNNPNDTGVFDGEKFLRSNGVDLDKALEFLGDMEMYNMTVGDYLTEIDNKISDLTKYKDTGDVSNYAILVHSMKSDAKYLGLMDFAEVAYQHELKSKANDLDYCIKDFDNLISLLQKKLNIIKEYNNKINK